LLGPFEPQYCEASGSRRLGFPQVVLQDSKEVSDAPGIIAQDTKPMSQIVHLVELLDLGIQRVNAWHALNTCTHCQQRLEDSPVELQVGVLHTELSGTPGSVSPLSGASKMKRR